jgi:hypothetical protein
MPTIVLVSHGNCRSIVLSNQDECMTQTYQIYAILVASIVHTVVSIYHSLLLSCIYQVRAHILFTIL